MFSQTPCRHASRRRGRGCGSRACDASPSAGPGDVRVHVDDVGAEGDVDRAGDAGPVRGQHQADVGVRAAEVVDVAGRGRRPRPMLVLAPLRAATAKASAVSRAMPKLPVVELRGHVLARLAGEGQLEVVDRRRAVHRHGADHAALDPVDQVRGAAGLDDVPADGRRDRLLVAAGSGRGGRGACGVRPPPSCRGRVSSQSPIGVASCGRPGRGRRRPPCSAARRAGTSSGR